MMRRYSALENRARSREAVIESRENSSFLKEHNNSSYIFMIHVPCSSTKQTLHNNIMLFQLCSRHGEEEKRWHNQVDAEPCSFYATLFLPFLFLSTRKHNKIILC